jgi:hypothetical protein
MMTLHLSQIKNKKCGFKKMSLKLSKWNLKISFYQMMNLIIRCIETFPIKEFVIFKNFKCHDFHDFKVFLFISHWSI